MEVNDAPRFASERGRAAPPIFAPRKRERTAQMRGQVMNMFLSASDALRGIAHAAPPLPVPTQARQRWTGVGEEPPLVEVLADPVVHLVMRRDGVTHIELEAIIRRAQNRLRNGHWRGCTAVG
ncbi:MAG: hypothetical protein ACHQRJ_15860 [Alphaproteobacteria bacterium]